MWRNTGRVAWLTLALVMLAPVGALAQSPDPAGPPLEARLPATIGGAPVEVVYSPNRYCRPVITCVREPMKPYSKRTIQCLLCWY